MSEIYSVRRVRRIEYPEPFMLPGSKSISNRALLLSALCSGQTRLSNFLFCDDTLYMTSALREAGLDIEWQREKGICEIIPGGRMAEKLDLNVGNAGTAMRFLTSYFALFPGDFRLDGNERMRQRPIADLIGALRQLGTDVRSEYDNGCPPVLIRGDGLPGGNCRIPGENSSQYISSLLISAPYMRSGLTLEVEGEAASTPYIDMTVSMMKRFGISVEQAGYSRFTVSPGQYISPVDYAVEPDASAASYFLAAVAVCGGKATLDGLGQNSLQGDARFADVLQQMGCRVTWAKDSVTIESDGQLNGVEIDMNKIPDTVLTLAVVALFAKSPTRITNVPNLRIKESDRISVLRNELTKLGAGVEEFADGLAVIPAERYRGAEIETYDDHRVAMAFTVAGSRIDGVEIKNPGCVSKTFPDFFEFWEKFVFSTSK